MEAPRVRRSSSNVTRQLRAVTVSTDASASPAHKRARIGWLRVIIVISSIAVAIAIVPFTYLRFTQTADFYGDSYSTGHGDVDHHRFSTLLCQTMKWRQSNFAVAGTLAEDPEQSGVIASRASKITDRTLSIWLAGFNDILFGGRAVRLHDFLTCVESDAALLAIPASRRLASDDSRITYHGDWTSERALSGMRVAHAGAFATFQLVGKTILIGTALVVNNPAKIRVLIDNTERAVYSNTMMEATIRKTFVQPALVKITGLEPGSHSVRVEAVDGGLTPFCWAAGLTGEPLRPRVYVGGVVAVGPSGYELVKGNTGEASLETSDLFSAGIKNSMAELASFGLNIRYSRPTLDITTEIADDRIHPNDAGNASLARQIASVMAAPP